MTKINPTHLMTTRQKVGGLGIISGIILAPIAIILGITRGCNSYFNEQDIVTQNYELHSEAEGLSRHVVYIKYNDGTREIRVHPEMYRFFDSETIHELNGDKKVDRIIRTASEMKSNKIEEVLTREADYEREKERFDEADELLEKLDKKYENKEK